MSERPMVGHRSTSHPADVRIEAWAPSRERCLAEAVSALVESFADVSSAAEVATVGLRFAPATDADLLVDVLERVIFYLDTEARLPRGVDVAPCDGGVDVLLRMTDTDRAEPIGAAPKAVSPRDLRFGPDGSGWSCGVTLDV